MTTSEGPPPRSAALRLRLAGHAARTAAALSRMTGRGSGAVIGGRVLLGLAPGAARALAEGRDVTLVSGTNGKTTTAAMLRAAFGVLGPVDGNVEGANTPPGLVSTLARRHGGRVVLETDEGWIPWAVEQVAPSRVVLLNLSRDQLSRHHEVHRLAMTWRRALSAVGVVVANADDPSVVWPALAARRVVWVATGQRWTGDSLTCPACGDRVHRHCGTWSCVCGLRRPEPDWWLEGDD
ncbi:MAG: Mur ligase family protein, partial [Nocardioidaceae bacterium]